MRSATNRCARVLLELLSERSEKPAKVGKPTAAAINNERTNERTKDRNRKCDVRHSTILQRFETVRVVVSFGNEF